MVGKYENVQCLCNFRQQCVHLYAGPWVNSHRYNCWGLHPHQLLNEKFVTQIPDIL